MKNSYLTLFLILFSAFVQAQEPFITTWEVQDGDLEITIPANLNNGMVFDYTIDFGDGTLVSNVDGRISHTYSQPGIYTVEISGRFPAINTWSLGYDADKLKTVEQWGDIGWKTMQYAFAFCRNLIINAIDAPDLSQVTNMSGMFWKAETINQPIEHWDVSNVIDMGAMFWGAHSFNQPLNNWNVSNVTNMRSMFARDDVSQNSQNLVFNQPLDNWDVSSVTSMEKMFYGASSFNQPINSWNVSNVTTMESMFARAASFNQPIGSWNVSNVTNMEKMFQSASDFNQSLNNWNVSNVTNMKYLFSWTNSFNSSINSWDISGLTSTLGMFRNTVAFNQPLDNWNLSNVTTMESMFEEALAFNQPIDSWDVSGVTSMNYLFRNATSFNQTLNSWNVSNVTSMSRIFQDAAAFNGLINDWDISGINSVYEMFLNARAFNQPLDSWNVSNLTSLSKMFEGASSFNQPLNSWDVSNITNMSRIFRDATTFNQSLNSWNVSSVGSFYAMFKNASSFNQVLDSWSFSSVNSLVAFLDNSALTKENYELFLEHLVSLNINDITLGVDSLEYCNEANRTILINDRGWNIQGDNLASDCYVISGLVTHDMDENGCDALDSSDLPIFVNITNEFYAYSKLVNNGAYTFSLSNDEIQNISLINIPNYFTVNPQNVTVDFSTTSTEQVDFCLTANQTIEDLNIRLLPIADARPGFEANYKLIIENRGTEMINNISASVFFDDAKQSFISATPAESSASSNRLDFSIASLNPFAKHEINLVMQTFAPPTVNSDDVLNFTASVLPSMNDYSPDNNTYELEQIVVNSFDPNDKRVVQGNTITTDETSNYLDYIIRFQNTGSTNAINVKITDNLHPNLEWSTLSVTSASHDYNVNLISLNIVNGNNVEFSFDNINLPSETQNELESHGYIAYKIKPINSIGEGDVMSGNASIYFDYNLPIITNTVSTEVVNSLSNDKFVIDNNVVIYPNPAVDVIFIKKKSNTQLHSVKLYNIQGRELINLKGNINCIDTREIASGAYILKMETNFGNLNKQIIIE